MARTHLVVAWGVLVLQGCTFSPDQCHTQADCPEGRACELEGDAFLCRNATTNNSEDPSVDMSTDETPSNTVSLPTCGSACAADAFEPNDSMNGASLVTEDILGCESFTFQTYDDTFSATICNEEDWYTLDLNPCEDRSYLLEIEVSLSSACSLDSWEVLGDWDCQSPQVLCSEGETSRRVRFLVRPEDERRWAEGLRFGLKSLGANTDYSVRITVAP